MSTKYNARFFIARNPKKPQYLHELNGSVYGGDLHLTVEGLTVSQTSKQITRTGGFKYSGQDRQGTKYNNKNITFSYQIKASSTSQVMAIKNSLLELINIANNNGDNNSVYKAYIELFLPNSAGMYTPLLGQYSKTLEIVDITNQSGNSLSNDTHNNTVDFLSLGNILNIECKPFLLGNAEPLPSTAAAIFNSPYGTVLHKQIQPIANHLADPAFNQDTITTFWSTSDPAVEIERLDKRQSLLNGDLRFSNNSGSDNGVECGYAADSDLVAGNQIIISAVVKKNHPLGFYRIKTPSGVVPASGGGTSPYTLNGKQYDVIYTITNVIDPLTDTVGLYTGSGQVIDVVIIQVTRATFAQTPPVPMAMGDLMGYKWNGDPHASVTLTKTEQNKVTHRIEGGLNKPFTISFWYSPLFKSFTIEELDTPVLRYDTDGGQWWEIGLLNTGVLYYKNSLPNTLQDTNDNRLYNIPVHIAITRGAVVGSIRVYRNGNLIFGDFIGDNPNTIYTAGELSFMGDAQGIIDGFKLWDNVAMTAAEVLAIYNEESPIKVGGGSVSGGLPYLYTREGFYKLGNIEGFTTKPNTSIIDTSNHAIIGGLSGHVSSVPNIKIINDSIESTPAPDTVYLSTIDYHKQFNISNTIYLDFNDPALILTGFGGVNDSALVSEFDYPTTSKLDPGQEYYFMFSIGGGGTYGQLTPDSPRVFRGTVPKNTQHAHLITGNIKPLVKAATVAGLGQSKEIELIIGYGLEKPRGTGEIETSAIDIIGFEVIPFNNIYLSNEKLSSNDEFFIGVRVKALDSNTGPAYVALDTINLLKNVAELRLIGDNVANNLVSATSENVVTYKNSQGKILSSVAIGFIDGDITLSPKQYNYFILERYDNVAGQKVHKVEKEFMYNKFKLNLEYTPLWEV